jgi:hypothetical protein
MNEDDLALRNLTYARFVDLGRAPTAAEVAVAGGRDRAEVTAGWERLHAEHALVLDQTTGGIRMANPFSGVPTAHRVPAAGRWWYGNCACDAFGMNLFRSGEHIQRWLAGREPGATTSTEKLSELAHAWWEDRLSPTGGRTPGTATRRSSTGWGSPETSGACPACSRLPRGSAGRRPRRRGGHPAWAGRMFWLKRNRLTGS